MPERPSRFAWVVKVARIWAVASLTLLAATFVATAVETVMAVMSGAYADAVIWLGLALLGQVVAGVLVVVVCGLVETIVANEQAVDSTDEQLRRIESLMEAIHESNRWLVDLAQMSDAAKSLLFRQHEIEAMDELLQEALIGQDYAKAESLAVEVEARLGYRDQAERMREQIATARDSTLEQKIDAALDHISKYIEAHDWAQAMRQSHRLLRLLPDNPKVLALPQLIRDSQAKHKRQLLQDYGEAVKVSDIDRSIKLLEAMDKYLTPQEAAALEESARGVFKAKLHSLGVRFAIRVTEENWAGAIDVGESIIREFPNSRMAQEVRQKMDQLRARATAATETRPLEEAEPASQTP